MPRWFIYLLEWKAIFPPSSKVFQSLIDTKTKTLAWFMLDFVTWQPESQKTNFRHTSAEWYGIHKKNELAKPRINYESRTIMWYKTPNFEWKKQANFEKTHISVILYYKIDHFCPLKSNFHSFSAIWPNVWIWNSLLPSFYHLLAQVRHAQSHFFPLGTNDWAKNKPRLKKFAVFFGNQESF